jgi:hypothetical protein
MEEGGRWKIKDLQSETSPTDDRNDARKMKKVNAHHVIMKNPSAEFRSSGDSYAARIPEEGQNMIPNDNQNAP